MARKNDRTGSPAKSNKPAMKRRPKEGGVGRAAASTARDIGPRGNDMVPPVDRPVAADRIEAMPIDRLRPNLKNARRHSERQIEQIAESTHTFGFVTPIIIDNDAQVLAGHGRLAAARRLGLTEVPCVRIDHLTDEAKRAFALADNRLAELADWDEELLAAELEELSALDLDFDVEVTGFDSVDLDRLLGPEPSPTGKRGAVEAESTDPDDAMPDIALPVVSRLGDLWVMGPHRLRCGDATDEAAYRLVMDGERADQVVTDPPYNVAIAGHVSGKEGFREFAMAAGEMSAGEFVAFLGRFLGLAARYSQDGAIFHTFMDWRHLDQLFAAANEAGLRLMNLCVWAKPQAGMGVNGGVKTDHAAA